MVIAGGWFSAAPYLGNERSQHTLDMITKQMEQGQSHAEDLGS